MLLLFLVCSLAIADEAKEPTITVPVSTLRALLKANDNLRDIASKALDQRDDARRSAVTCMESRST